MKTIKRQDINLNQFITRKTIPFLSDKDGDYIFHASRDELTLRGEADKKVVQFDSTNANSPGVLFALYEHIKKSFDVSEESVSGFKCKVYLPGSEGLVDPSTLMTHSRYFVVLPVNPSSKKESEDKMAKDAMLSVLDVEDDDDGDFATIGKNSSSSAKRSSALKSSHQKAKEVFTFSIQGMSKPLLVEEGHLVGLDGMFSNAIATTFNNQKTFKMPPISNGYRETFVQKKPDRRLVLVFDVEQSPAGLAKSVEKMKNLMQKKKMFGF